MSMLIEMWSLNPYRLLLNMRTTTDDLREIAPRGVAFDIELKEANGCLPLVGGLTRHRSVVHDIGFAIIVEQQVGIDTNHFRQPDWVAPSFGGILCLDKEIAASYVCRDHIERLVAFVVADRRCIDASVCDGLVGQRQLRRTVKNVTCRLPTDEILRCGNGHAGIRAEGRVDHVERLAYTADARIRIIARTHRIEILPVVVIGHGEALVLALIGEIGERTSDVCPTPLIVS